MSEQTKPDKPPKEKPERDRSNVEMFQSVATFGFLAAAMFCLGGPLVLAFGPNLSRCFRHVMIMANGLAGAAVVACVLYYYYQFASKPAASGPTRDDTTEETTETSQGDRP